MPAWARVVSCCEVRRTAFGSLTLWDGRPLPETMKAGLERRQEHLGLVERRIGLLENERRQRLSGPKTVAERSSVQLVQPGAIGPERAWLPVKEFSGWAALRNRRDLAALAGLMATD